MYSPELKYIELRFRGSAVKLRRSLFWDVLPEKLDPEKNRRLILERVFSRGNMQEFKAVMGMYSMSEIKETIVSIGSFDKKTLSFLSKNFQIPLSDFRCYTPIQ